MCARERGSVRERERERERVREREKYIERERSSMARGWKRTIICICRPLPDSAHHKDKRDEGEEEASPDPGGQLPGGSCDQPAARPPQPSLLLNVPDLRGPQSLDHDVLGLAPTLQQKV